MPRIPWKSTALLAALTAIAVTVSGCGTARTTPPKPFARTGPETIFEAPLQLQYSPDPAGALDQLRRLGADRIRVIVQWSTLAPNPTARVRPSGFNGGDPAAYPAPGWKSYDTLVRDATARGIALDFSIQGKPPLWASGRGAPKGEAHPEWMPSATDYGAFVRAIATRYSGTFKPAGASSALPRVSFWSIWNEPNYGVELAPQAIDHSALEVAPRLYRGLVDAGWQALHATGHGADTILIGEFAPRGQTFGGHPGSFDGMVPLRFIRALYCVDSSLHQLRGTAAAQRGCPTDAAGSSMFVSEHPGLFKATGVAVHPYPQGKLAPNVVEQDEPDYADLASIARLETTLDRINAAYGSGTRLPLYSTEFGYQTNPPEARLAAIDPTTAADYLNWAEYITWRNLRLRSFNQYLLTDPPGGNFASGLEFANNNPKPAYAAFRMPIYMPVTSIKQGDAAEVWGCVRPARFARIDSGAAQRVRIEFAASPGAAFHTLQTVLLTDPYGYFDVRQKFPSSGVVRLAWSYPNGQKIFSRTVGINVR